MQKHHLLALAIMLALNTSTTHASWFGNEEEKQRRIQVEQQLNQQRKETDGWQIVAGTFAVFAGIAFTVGTILGSRTRRKGGDGQ